MERAFRVLVKAVVSTTTKVVSGMTAVCKSAFSMMEEVGKQLDVSGLVVLLLRVLECFFGGTGWIAFAIFVLEIIISLRPWKKD